MQQNKNERSKRLLQKRYETMNNIFNDHRPIGQRLAIGGRWKAAVSNKLVIHIFVP